MSKQLLYFGDQPVVLRSCLVVLVTPVIQIYLELEYEGRMVRQNSSLGNMFTEFGESHLAGGRGGYSEDNILADSQPSDAAVSLALPPHI